MHAGHRDRQKPANGTQYPTLMTARDLLHALLHRHGTAFRETVTGIGGDEFITCRWNSTLLNQTDCARLKPGPPA